MKSKLVGTTLAVCASAALAAPSFGAIMVSSGSAGNALGLLPTVDMYRFQLGGPNNGNDMGPIVGGRREINWDAAAVPFDMPGDFFNTTVPRGAVFSTPGSGFAVSDPLDSNDPGFPDKEFSSFDAGNPIQFATFSASRLFSPVGSNIVEVTFRVPGKDTEATVNGFGAVFTDVDLPDSTKIEYFGADDDLILTQAVPVSDGGLSFAGITLDSADIAKVVITAGSAHIENGAEDIGAGFDLVVMDDFIYGEPTPEPMSAMILSIGGMGLMFRRRG